MKNNGKMRDVCSLTVHWNNSEMVYCLIDSESILNEDDLQS